MRYQGVSRWSCIFTFFLWLKNKPFHFVVFGVLLFVPLVSLLPLSCSLGFPVSSPAVAHTLPPSVVAPLILYSKSLSMGLLQHTGFLKHIFFLSLNSYDFHLRSTSSTQSQNYTLWILTMFRIFHLRGHKCQFPSLSLAFSPARPALSTVSDLTRPFYFPSRCQSPLGFSSVVDHLKSQSWILQICPANQHHSKAPICGLCSYCRSGGLSWGKDYTATWSWV